MPRLLALCFHIDLSRGHANNFHVQNVTWALADKLIMKSAGSVLQETIGYNIYKTFEDLFLSQERQNNMLFEEIQSED